MQLLRLTDAIEIPNEADEAKWMWVWEGHTLRMWQWPAISTPIVEALERKSEDKSNGVTQVYLDENLIWWNQGDLDILKIWHQLTELLLMHDIACEPFEMMPTQYSVNNILSSN